ncbi:MAG: M16 family metallopeptidase [Bacteroidales bacterium]
MILYNKKTLDNGLTVIAHRDKSSPLCTIALLYKVGSRNEQGNKTGFAHLFEHLMFGGSRNAPLYDVHVQRAGGESNAFTTNDFTCYYLTLPTQNIELGLWLESDRMQYPLLNAQTLKIQQQVVIEEFNQRYLNQPYGDAQLLLRPLAYKIHPYQWSTIGQSIEHIASATLNDVQDFFCKFYTPHNAILSIAGNLPTEHMIKLVEKYFNRIKRGNFYESHIPQEPKQTEERILHVKRKVPASAIFKAYQMPNRLHVDYHCCDVITDILASGKSARLYRNLVQGKGFANSANAYISNDIDVGLTIVTAHLLPTVSMPQIEDAILEELHILREELVGDYELEKVKNRIESQHTFSETTAMQKSLTLACAEMLGNIELANIDIENYRKITSKDIQRVATSLFSRTNCSTLYYEAE